MCATTIHTIQMWLNVSEESMSFESKTRGPQFSGAPTSYIPGFPDYVSREALQNSATIFICT